MTTEFRRIQHLRGAFADWAAAPGNAVVPLIGELAMSFMGATAPNKARVFAGDGSFSMGSGIPLSIPEVRISGLTGVAFLPTTRLAGIQLAWGTEPASGAPNFTITYPFGATFQGNPMIQARPHAIADVNSIARLTVVSNAGFSSSILLLNGNPVGANDAELYWFAMGPALNPGYET